MSRREITDLRNLTDALDLSTIESHLWDELTRYGRFYTVEQIINELESASCSAGSWSGFIYTRDIRDRLTDWDLCDDIEDALQDYADNTGEQPSLDHLTFDSLVTFAVDWKAYSLASKVRSLRSVYRVTIAADSCDPRPDVIVFTDEDEATEWLADEVQRRVDWRVQHSHQSVTEEERQEWEEQEMSLCSIEEENL
jgi:hypothetical protein